MSSENYSKRTPHRFPSFSPWLIALVVVGLIATIYYFTNKNQAPAETQIGSASLSQIATAISANEIKSMAIRGDTITATKTDGTKISARKESSVSAIEILRLLGAPSEKLNSLPMTIEEPTTPVNPLSVIGIFGFVALLIILLFRNSRQPQGGGNSSYNFSNMGRSNPRIIGNNNQKDDKTKETQPQVTFQDVAGADQAKLELQEVIEFLKEPAKFLKLGARVPRGVLMAGPPGTGKTLLAKAVAGEAGVPFFSISGSEFVEMFVGVGAARVRDLFKRAREQAPAVVFVDEIDAVGRHRGVSMGSGNDEREQTLNQILVEMDGFTTDTNVIVMASTNRPDILDPALLRPGRFDRRVILDRPDWQGRKQILGVHVRGKPLSSDVNLDAMAKRTIGFSGADLENVVNEGAILAARRNQKQITEADLEEAVEKIRMGPERRSRIRSEEEMRATAYHEAGHALVAYMIPDAHPVHKVTIVARGSSLGLTSFLPEDDQRLVSRSAFKAQLAVGLGGRVADEIVFNDVNTGASQDLQRVTYIARDMVTRYGMSEKLGPLTFGDKEELIFLGRQLSEQRNYSEETAEHIDFEVRELVAEAHKRAHQILTEHLDKLHLIANYLMEKETIEADEFVALLGGERGNTQNENLTSQQGSASSKDSPPRKVPPPATAPLPA